MNQSAFRIAFTAGPLLICSIVPSILFGVLVDQWGSNLVWGSIFGLGWCLSAFAAGGLMHNSFATAGGLLWAWLVPIAPFFGSGWLWNNLNERRRKIALMALAFTFLLDVPAKTIMNWDAHHFHLPDFSLHLAESY
jgi:hypothetical protein